MKRKLVVANLVLVSLFGAVLMAIPQDKPAVKVEDKAPSKDVTVTASPEMLKLTLPQLSDVQKLTIRNLALTLDNAQLRAQQAQRDFDAAREAIGKLVQSLQVDGYTLDLQRLEYVKKVEPKKDK